MRLNARILLLIVIPLVMGPSIYKWVDKDGTVHYSDTPPPETETTLEQVEIPDSPPAPPAPQHTVSSAAPRPDPPSLSDAPGENGDAMTLEIRKGRCERAREEIGLLVRQLPVYLDEAGNIRVKWEYDSYRGKREYLDDAARKRELRRVHREITTFCEDPHDIEKQAAADRRYVRSEKCALVRAELEAAEKPSARSTRQELEERRRLVALYCDE